jgi:hypothetical protein
MPSGSIRVDDFARLIKRTGFQNTTRRTATNESDNAIQLSCIRIYDRRYPRPRLLLQADPPQAMVLKCVLLGRDAWYVDHRSFSTEKEHSSRNPIADANRNLRA